MSQRDQRYQGTGRGGQPQNQQPQRYSPGLTTLGAPKRGRGPGGAPVAAPGPKLAIPKPVNLPSLKKENAGLDPNTQLVPAAGGGWNKPEEPAPPPEAPADDASPLTAGSTWGSSQARSAAAPWQPPDPAASAPAPVPYRARIDRRRLNPSEYPSLEAAGRNASLVDQLGLTRAPTSALLGPPSGLDTSNRNWDDEDRVAPAAPAPPRPSSAGWYGGDRYGEDVRPLLGRPPPPADDRRPVGRSEPPADAQQQLPPVQQPPPPPPPAPEQAPEPSWEQRQQPVDSSVQRERERPPPGPASASDSWRGPPAAATNGRPMRSALTDGPPPPDAYGYGNRGPAPSNRRPGSWDDERRHDFRGSAGYDDRGAQQRRGSYDGGFGATRDRYDNRQPGPPGRGHFDGPPPYPRNGQQYPPQRGGMPAGRFLPHEGRPLTSALVSDRPSALISDGRSALVSSEQRPMSQLSGAGSGRDPPASWQQDAVGGRDPARPLSAQAPQQLPAEEEHVDDSEAFMAELDRIAAEEEAKKQAKIEEAAAAAAAAVEAKEAEEAAAAAVAKAEEVRRAEEAERAKGRAPPRPRAEALAEEAEAEERRKAAAQAKLDEINARIAAREAEAAKEAELKAAEAAAEAEAKAKADAEAAAAAEAAAREEAEKAAEAAAAEPPAKAEEVRTAAALPEKKPVATEPPPPPVNAWAKPLSLGPPPSPPAAQRQPSPPPPQAPAATAAAEAAANSVAMVGAAAVAEQEQQAEIATAADSAAPAAAAKPAADSAAGGQVRENAWHRAKEVPQPPVRVPTDVAAPPTRGGRGGRGRARSQGSAPRDIAAAAPTDRQQPPQPPPRASPKDGAGRKRGRGSKPPGRTLPIPAPAQGAKPDDGSTTFADPAAAPQQPAAAQPEQQLPQAALPRVILPASQPVLMASHSNGGTADAQAQAVGHALAGIVLAEPQPDVLPRIGDKASAVNLDPIVQPAIGSGSTAPAAATAPIARPRSSAALDDTLASGVLANGIPALPADLSLDAPGGSMPQSGSHGTLQGLQQQPGGFSFQQPVGGMPQQQPHQQQQHHAQGIPAFAQGGFGFGAFGFGAGAPVSAGGLWQQPPPPQQQAPASLSQQAFMAPQQHHSPPPGLMGSRPPSAGPLNTLYNGQNGPMGSGGGFARAPQHAPASGQLPGASLQMPQFGSFGGGFGAPQGGHNAGAESAFGGFGQTAFVPTGKQPDWSVPSMGGGTASLQPSLSGGGGGGVTQGFAAARTGSGGLGGGMVLQQPSAGQQFQAGFAANQQAGGFGAPMQHQQGGHGFYNQTSLGLPMMGQQQAPQQQHQQQLQQAPLQQQGGMSNDAALPEDLMYGGEGDVRMRPHSSGPPGQLKRDGGPKVTRGGGSGANQFGGPPMRDGRGGRGGLPPGGRGGRAQGRGEGRANQQGRGRYGGRGGRGGHSPAVMKPAYANKPGAPGYGGAGQQQQQPQRQQQHAGADS